MFTGIVDHMGEVVKCSEHELIVSSQFKEITLGESLSINGVCLTVKSSIPLSFDLSYETLNKTNLGFLKPMDKVNLERSMSVNARFSGHYVSGHVDTRVGVKRKEWLNECCLLVLGDFLSEDEKFLMTKGSITVNGVSLTINKIVGQMIELMLVPYTLSATNLSELNVGDQVNIEFDYITRVVIHRLNTLETLQREVTL